jgi:GT2 family glycosyltransferase
VSPSVTIVFLVYNRCEELRTSLREMLFESDYDGEIDVIVVDNASTDDSSAMVAKEFPQVRLIRRELNCGVSGWNDGFAEARGDWVLALDDDCYLPGDGLTRAVDAANERGADLVSFAVRASADPDYRFNERYRTGLLSYWGCAVLMKREVIDQLRGYDPEIFVWANELEFMVRFFDRGLRHLHLPEVEAVHMKTIGTHWTEYYASRSYRINARHFAYIAAKLMRPRDAAEALIALIVGNVRDAARVDRRALPAVWEGLKGFAHGLRHRDPVRNPQVSRTYRRNFQSYASPWWVSRPLSELIRAAPAELTRGALGRGANGSRPPGRRELYFTERARYYPDAADTLEF